MYRFLLLYILFRINVLIVYIAIFVTKPIQTMFTHKDINMRTIFVVNCIEHARKLRVNDGELLLEDIDG